MFSLFHRSKSPSLVPNPSLYSDALNASLQSALGFSAEGGLPFLNQSMAAANLHRERDEKQRMGMAAAMAER